ncbi:hypothetical protein BGZ83_010271 [Gryganskiella cystojenkinii]|nr:hypothetical protein BGZ83_010271 [Gryganskiella cystojenkinii]
MSVKQLQLYGFYQQSVPQQLPLQQQRTTTMAITSTVVLTSPPTAHQSYSRTLESLRTKPCAAKGHRECVKGFLTDNCHKCTRGSIACNMCSHNNKSGSSTTCIFCFDGHKECDDCFGIGYVQRICQDCVKAHYKVQQHQSTSPVSVTAERVNLIGSKFKSQISAATHTLQRQSLYQNSAALLSTKSLSSLSPKRLSFSGLSTKSSSSA